MSASRLYTSPNGPTYILPASLYDYFVSQPGGEPERPLIDWVLQNFIRPEWDFVDAGAHVGTYTLHFAKRAREVWAFEPQESTYRRLVGGVALSGQDNIHVFHTALGAVWSPPTTTLKRQYDDGGLSTLAENIPHAAGFPEELVSVKPLDAFKLEKVGFMKIDVEGYEISVLEGASETLKRSGWPRLLVELWTDDWFRDRREAVRAKLQAFGYRFELDPVKNYPHMILCIHPDTTVKW